MVDARRRHRSRVDKQRTPGARRLLGGERRETLALLVPRVLGAPHVERLAAAHHVAVLAQALDGGLYLHPVSVITYRRPARASRFAASTRGCT